jgi:hypothetical protein
MQTNILDGGPDNCEATHFGSKHVDLIGALPHIAKQAFNRIRRLNIPVHGYRKLVKGQQGARLIGCVPNNPHTFVFLLFVLAYLFVLSFVLFTQTMVECL